MCLPGLTGGRGQCRCAWIYYTGIVPGVPWYSVKALHVRYSPAVTDIVVGNGTMQHLVALAATTGTRRESGQVGPPLSLRGTGPRSQPF